MSSILIFLAVGGTLAVLVNLVLPRLWYRFRLRTRWAWASAQGFQPCGPPDAARLDAAAPTLSQPRRRTLLSCLTRGPLTLVDYAFTQSIGGAPADSVDVRRAMTAVLCPLDREVPRVTIRPQLRGVPRVLLNRVARAAKRDPAIFDAIFASIRTGDDAFDSAFRVVGDGEPARAVLTPSVRAVMLANTSLTYEICGRHIVVSAPRLAFGEPLDRLIAAAEALRREVG